MGCRRQSERANTHTLLIPRLGSRFEFLGAASDFISNNGVIMHRLFQRICIPVKTQVQFIEFTPLSDHTGKHQRGSLKVKPSHLMATNDICSFSGFYSKSNQIPGSGM